jgi:cytochrome c biogenesis protein
MPTSPADSASLDGRGGGPLRPLARALAWLYRQFASIKTSIYVLSATAVLYVIGTIFPQGGDIGEYEKAGGALVSVVRTFSFLDFFSSPLFLSAAFVLFLNLLICTIERYPAAFGRRRSYQRAYPASRTFYLTQGITDAHDSVRKVLREELGFRVVSKDGDWIVMERGLPYRAITWVYHAGILACFMGLVLTYLFAFEDIVTLPPGKTVEVKPSVSARLSGVMGYGEAPDFSLVLDGFLTEYAQSPDLDYPKDKLSRLAIGLGWKAPAYEIKDGSIAAKDWKSVLRVVKDGSTVMAKTIEVNDPLKYGGYTFYQVGYEQRLKVRVDNNPIPLEATTDRDLVVPGLDAPLRFSTLRTGSLARLDGGIETITPNTSVKQRVRTKDGKTSSIDAGRLEIGGSIEIDGARIALVDFDESSVLSYRYDPGVPVLWWAGIAVLLAMVMRFFGLWYMLAYNVHESDGIVCLDVHVRAKGLSACEGRLLKRLERCLTRDDIRPSELPPLP